MIAHHRSPPPPTAQTQEAPLAIVYREDAAPYALPAHHHASHELIFTTCGRSRFHIAGRLYEVSPGDLLLISNLEPHDVEVLAWPYHRYYVLIRPDALQAALRSPALEALFRYRPEAFRHKVHLDTAENTQMETLLQQMLREQQNGMPFWESAMENLLRTLLIHLYRSHPERFPPAELSSMGRDIIEVQRYIDHHETEPLRLDEVAERFHFDRYHLSRSFHRTTGYGFKEYIVRRRVNRATQQLRATADSVALVAADCGFNSVPHFIRTFRSIMGVTPLQFRKSGISD